jgi:poly-beta-1,6-N-acetyl-D-glucosamine biosynthesis protein PgaD
VTDLVINAPHLQTSGQRISAFGLAVFGWLLWCYLFFPLVTLGCWLVDDDNCSQWVNMAGGYLNLREMLEVYSHAILAIMAAWAGWLGYNCLRHISRREINAVKTITEGELIEAFGVDSSELRICQSSRIAIVHYDGDGHIVGLEALPEVSA